MTLPPTPVTAPARAQLLRSDPPRSRMTVVVVVVVVVLVVVVVVG